MYLEELLNALHLCEDPDEDQQIVMVPAGLYAWATVNAVVERKDLDATFVKFRASEPDAEMVCSLLSRTDTMQFKREFAELLSVKKKYSALLQDYNGTVAQEESVVESTFQEQSSTACGVDADADVDGNVDADVDADVFVLASKESVEVEDMEDLHSEFESEYERSDIESEFGVPEVGADMDGESEISGDFLGNTAFQDDRGESSIGSKFPELGVGDEAPAVAITDVRADASGATVDEVQRLAPEPEIESVAPDSEPLGEEVLSSEAAHDSEQEDFDSKEFVAVSEATFDQPTESEIQQEELRSLLSEIRETHKISHDVNAWASECADVFNEISSDLAGLVQEIPVVNLLWANNMDVSTFLSLMSEKMYTPNSLPVSDIQSWDDFWAIFDSAYASALMFCAIGDEDKGVELARVYMDLLYER